MTDRNSLAFRVTDLLVQSSHFMMSEDRPRRVSAAYDLALDICNTARRDDFHPVSAAWEVFDDWLHFLRAEVGEEEIECVPLETLTSWFADCATVEGAIGKALLDSTRDARVRNRQGGELATRMIAFRTNFRMEEETTTGRRLRSN